VLRKCEDEAATRCELQRAWRSVKNVSMIVQALAALKVVPHCDSQARFIARCAKIEQTYR